MQEPPARTSELCHECGVFVVRPADAPRFAAWEECHGCAGGPSTMRGFAYNTRMNRLFDKSIVLACCIAAAMGLAVDAHLVAAFCLGVIATSLAEVAQGERTGAQARPQVTLTSSRLSSCRRLCRLCLSSSMTSRDACAVNASGPRWRLAPCLSARLSRTFVVACSPPERCC